MRIDLWSGSIGGHGRIAEALAWALNAARPEAEVRVIDVYGPAFVNPRYSAAVNRYDSLVARLPRLWRSMYRLSNHRRTLSTTRWLSGRLASPAALRRQWAGRPPDVIVNVIADLGPLRALTRAYQPAPPMVTVISDPVNVHRAWVAPEAGLIVTPTEEATAACRAFGVPEERLQQLGYPIRSHLYCTAGERTGPRPEGPLRVLMMGGSSGAGRVLADLRALLESGLPLELTVVCGKNQRLRAQAEALAGAAGLAQLSVLGYTENVPGLMRSADVLLTKAGPSTLFEAVVSELPAIVTGWLPGQEDGNAAFFSHAGVALASTDPDETVRLIRRFAADPAQLAQMRNPALRLETCAAAGRIAAAILAVGDGAPDAPPAERRLA